MSLTHQRLQSRPIFPFVQIDKEGANIERVRNELSEQGLVWDQWGGDTAMLPVSTKGRRHTVLLLCCLLSCRVFRQRVFSLLWLLSCTCPASAQCFALGVTGNLDRLPACL